MDNQQKQPTPQDQPAHPPESNQQAAPRVVVGHFGQNEDPAVSEQAAPEWLVKQQAPAEQHSHVGLTGSQLQPEKQRLPFGVYLIVAFLFLGIIVSFFDSSQASLLYTISMVVNLLLGFGLLFRLEAARKILVVLSSVLVVVYTGILIFSFALQQRVNDSVAKYNAVVSVIDERQLTPSQKEQLRVWDEQIADAHKKVGKAFTFMYIRTGAYMLLMAAIVFYLARPKVKEAFNEHQ